MPDAETVIAFVLALFDQMTVPAQLLAVRITFVPKHTILSVSSEVIVQKQLFGQITPVQMQ